MALDYLKGLLFGKQSRRARTADIRVITPAARATRRLGRRRAALPARAPRPDSPAPALTRRRLPPRAGTAREAQRRRAARARGSPRGSARPRRVPRAMCAASGGWGGGGGGPRGVCSLRGAIGARAAWEEGGVGAKRGVGQGKRGGTSWRARSLAITRWEARMSATMTERASYHCMVRIPVPGSAALRYTSLHVLGCEV